MKAFHIDSITNEARFIETDAKLESLYKLTRCRCIDIVVRHVNGVPFNVVCDDEGLLVDNPTFTAWYRNGTPAIAGSIVLFALDDDTGDLSGIDENGEMALEGRVGELLKRDLSLAKVVILDSPHHC